MRPLPLFLLSLAIVAAGCTDAAPQNDADGDLVEDDVEREGVTIRIFTAKGEETRLVTADPSLRDTDGDGLLDGDEMLVRLTDPRDVDTDDDGLLDGEDITPTDPDVAEAWRKAGILEVNGTFLGELNACPPGGPQLRANVASSDLPIPDKIDDGDELRGWSVEVRGSSRHVTSDPCVPDTDGDGLLDHDERDLGSDPRSADTDGDGARDGSDADPFADLGLRFADAVVTGPDSARIHVVFSLAEAQATLAVPGNLSARLDVPDQGSRDAHEVSLTLYAEDVATGRRLALFDDPRGVILTFDLIQGTVGGAVPENGTLRFEGGEGTLTFSWAIDRR